MTIIRRTGRPHSSAGAQVAADDLRAPKPKAVRHHEHVGGDAARRRRRRGPSAPRCPGWPGACPRPDRARRRLVQARRVAHRPLDEVLEDADGDVVEEQAADGLVDAAVARAARPERATHAPPTASTRRRPCAVSDDPRRCAPRARGRDRPPRAPPMTSAPSPPMMMRPSCAGRAVQSAVSMSGRRAQQRVLQREPDAERAAVHLVVDVERRWPPRAPRRRRRSRTTRHPASGMPTASTATTIEQRTSAAAARVCTPTGSVVTTGSSRHAFDEVRHLLERDVGLHLRPRPRAMIDLAGVVVERARVDDERPVGELGLRGVGLLLGVVGDGRAVGRHLDESLLEAAAEQVRSKGFARPGSHSRTPCRPCPSSTRRPSGIPWGRASPGSAW